MTEIVWDGVQRGYIPPEQLRIGGGLRLHEETTDTVDPVTFEVVRYSLMNTNLEHGQTLQRLCVSPVTMITRDFQPSIATERGDLVFLGPYLQYFSNAQSLTIKWILENRAENPGIEPGDMFVSNDPYVGTPHQPDTIVAAPVFVGDELFCWVANVLHHADVGGTVMGSFCVDATDIYSDPPSFPPFKLVSRGEVRADLEQMFLRQSRVPSAVHMDLRAAVSANTVAVQKVVALVERYGAGVVKTVMNRLLDAGEQAFADRLSGVPDGEWTHRMYAEAAHTGDPGLYAYQLTVRKQGGHLYVDNAGTDPQAGSINVSYAGLTGAFLAALTAAMTADLAGAYGGVYRRVHFDPTPGTLSCADFPAAVSPSGIYTMETLISLSGAVISKMLSCASPDLQRLAIGPANATFYGFIGGGVLPSGAPYIGTNANNMIGGLSATPGSDGLDFGGHFWIPEGTASNIEELEMLWPQLWLYRRALPAGADGAGAFRGGRGFVEATIPWTVPGMAAAVYTDESFPKTVGPFGGNPGSVGHFRLKHGSDVQDRFAAGQVPQDFGAIAGTEQEIEAKGPMLMMGADGVWEWTGASGVGYGDPLSREPALVAADVASGALDAGAADRVYGVVLSGDGTPDEQATEDRRAALLAARLAAATPPARSGLDLADDAPIQVLAGELAVQVDDDRPVTFVSAAGRRVLGSIDENYKDGCAVLERPLPKVAEEYRTRDGRAGAGMRYREYLCPVTGYRIDSEVVRAGDTQLHDIRLAVG